MVNQSITEGVIRTRSKLRRDLLISVFDEFDGSIMSLSPDNRREKYSKMAQSAFSFYRGALICSILTRQDNTFPTIARQAGLPGFKEICISRTSAPSAVRTERLCMM